jgi:hypothetical protein
LRWLLTLQNIFVSLYHSNRVTVPDLKVKVMDFQIFCHKLSVNVVDLLPVGFNNIDALQKALKDEVRSLMIDPKDGSEKFMLRELYLVGEISEDTLIHTMKFNCLRRLNYDMKLSFM